MTSTARAIPDGAYAEGWHRGGSNAWRYVKTHGHDVGGFVLRLHGEAEQHLDSDELLNPRIVFQVWKKHSYFEESDEIRALTAREGRQLAYVLLALAEEIEGWT